MKTKWTLFQAALRSPGQALLGIGMLAGDWYKQTRRRYRYWMEEKLAKVKHALRRTRRKSEALNGEDANET